jgi:NADH-quinone oxidoreductase subunit K
MTITLGHYLALAVVLFTIGTLGFALRRNVLIVLMSIELQLNAVNLVFVAANRFHPENHVGQTTAFFTIAIAAAEAAVGLAIVLAYFRLRQSVHTDEADSLRH